MAGKLRIAVLFGGRSAEREVSIMSGRNVIRAIDTTRYEVVPILVSRSGRWQLIDLQDGAVPDLLPETGAEVCLLPGGQGRMLALSGEGALVAMPAVDLLFPVLHGPHGEDGSVQGYAAVADVPLAGCGILGSATAIDKEVAKRLLSEAGLPVARAKMVERDETVSFDDVAAELNLPVFVKPARQGSSVGVGKAGSANEFHAALGDAFQHDRKVLIEECILGREIECSVLEHADGEILVSVPGEIVTAGNHDFYSYEAKYLDEKGAVLDIPARLPDAVTEEIRDMALRAFRALGCDGMARVDFFLRPDMTAVVNEVNTIPGFTDISMYPKALAAGGITYPELIDRLIEHGLARHRQSA